MEDGVAVNRKVQARTTIAQALGELDFGASERLARINAVGSGLEFEDLDKVLPAHPDGIVIPKVESAEQITRISKRITIAEKESGWPVGGICLLVIVETARGIVNLPQIAGSGPRLEAIIFGSEDFAGDIGATRTPEGWEVFYARSAVVTHAAAFGLQAIDLVYVDLKEMAGLLREAQEGAQMGFAGKQIIHPNQVNPVQEAFTPGDEAIARALHVIEAFNHHQQAGVGAFALDGKMVDAPVVKNAERIIALAQAARKI
jgi:citrate lyase subunit beta-like protein